MKITAKDKRIKDNGRKSPEKVKNRQDNGGDLRMKLN
jgi:hypothetical protein